MLFNAIGRMTPPSEEPATAIPIAAPRFLWKYWPTAAMPGAMLILRGSALVDKKEDLLTQP